MNFVRVTTFRRESHHAGLLDGWMDSSVRHLSLAGRRARPEMLNYILLDSVRALPLLIIYFALLFFCGANPPAVAAVVFTVLANQSSGSAFGVRERER
jgi:hypothetical protein